MISIRSSSSDRDDGRETHTEREKAGYYFACFGESFPNLAVASPVACCDEVSDAAALQEGGGGDGAICAEDLGEGNHLCQAETNHGCFGVVAEPQAITETSAYCDNVLQ